MDFQKFQNEVPADTPPSNGEPFMLIKSNPAEISISLRKKFCVFGWFQLIRGLLLILFNIAAIFTRSSLTMYVGPGIWVGIFVVICGIFGVVIFYKTSRGYVITFMILSIISSIMIWIVIGFTISGLIYDVSYSYWQNNDSKVAMNAVLLIIGSLEFVFAIVASAYGCGFICCNNQPSTYIPVRMDMYTNKLVFDNAKSPENVINKQFESEP